MSIQGDILSVRLRSRATVLRMIVAREWDITRKDLRHQLREIATELDRDAERVMSLEVKQGHSA